MPESPLQTGTDTRRPSPAYAWYTVVLCLLAYILSFVDRQIIALLVQPIQADLDLSDTQFSLLSGLAFAIFYALMGLPIARWADVGPRPLIISAGIVLWSLATAVCGLARSFWQLFMARMAVGVGEAALSPTAYSIITDSFPKSKLGLALGIYSTGVFLGSGLAFLVGGAAHLSQCRDFLRNQKCPGTRSRGGQCGFRSGVTSTDHDDIDVCRHWLNFDQHGSRILSAGPFRRHKPLHQGATSPP